MDIKNIYEYNGDKRKPLFLPKTNAFSTAINFRCIVCNPFLLSYNTIEYTNRVTLSSIRGFWLQQKLQPEVTTGS